MVNDRRNCATLNLPSTRMRLCDNLIFAPQKYRGETYYHIESGAGKNYYRIGYSEYVFVSLLDGKTTFSEALAITSQILGSRAVTTEQATTVYHWILENGLGALVETSTIGTQRKASGRDLARSNANWNPFWIKIPLGDPGPMLDALVPITAWLFSPLATMIGLLFITLGGLSIATDWDQLRTASDVIFSPGNWLWLPVAWIILKVLHELAHAIVCRTKGGQVKEFGVVLALFAPLAYVDASSCWRLPSKWDRIHVAAAGIYVELIIAAAAAMAWQHVQSPLLSHILFNLIVMASISTILFNANPLMRFDGYFILADLLEVPNLYTEGAKTVRRQCGRLLLGADSRAPIARDHQSWIAIYGWMAAGWRIVVSVSIIIAASVMFHGAGIVLSVFAVCVWFSKPVLKSICTIADLYHTNRLRVCRAILVSTAVVGALAVVVLRVPSPSLVSAPGVVQYRDVSNVRSHTSGFIRKVLVANGQLVSAGDLLFVLENQQISNEYHDLQLAVEQAEIRRSTAINRHEIAAVQVAAREIDALIEQLTEATRLYAALNIIAPQAGMIVRRDLREMLGTYVNEGEQLLSIGRGAEKELVVAVGHRDLDRIVPQIGKPVRIRVGSQSSFKGTLVRLEPRASTRLVHPALSSVDGGPLDVVASSEQDASDSVELTEPRFRAIVSVPADDAIEIFSGRRAQVMFGGHRESIGRTLYTTIDDWIASKLSQ